MRTRFAALIVCVTLGLTGVHARQNQLSVLTSSPFESYLESLRSQAGIPGMSAALVQDGQIVWERGFGFQNVEARVRATPDTPYPVADISQTLASVLVLQCIEERRLAIDEPIRRYGGVVPGSGGDTSTGYSVTPRPARAKASATNPSATRSSRRSSNSAFRSRIARPSR